MPKTVLVEWNEVNFELIQKYLDDDEFLGRWPNIRKLMKMSCVQTTSENRYELLEPWIQWTSVHTGYKAQNHNVFRLGDINKVDIPQVFELVEKNGYSVGCLSAMNVANKLTDEAFFIPDPWTVTRTDGSFLSEAVYKALYQTVNDNSSGKITKKSLINLLFAILTQTQLKNWPQYLRLAKSLFNKRKWNKALFLDLFISDLHLAYVKRTKPDFTTVFFNGLAHIQHHYLFSSKHYNGQLANPNWYIQENIDPYPNALDTYDIILKDILNAFKDIEVIVATGLRQVPYDQYAYYYRLRDHQSFLSKIGVNDVKVYPRMTRDFLIECETEEQCIDVQNKLEKIKINNVNLFGEIDNRGNSLFVTLTYSNEIKSTDKVTIDSSSWINIYDNVVFVALKNGMHDQLGYIYSTSPRKNFESLNNCHVCNLHNYLLDSFVK